ncbi:MAG: hypothetical protein ACI8RD_009580 [Bacillariaceae sp.]|jgi:hypothetical protein
MYGHSKKSACTLITLAYCLDLPSSLSNTILPIVSCTVLTPTFDGSVLSFSYLVIQAVWSVAPVQIGFGSGPIVITE